MCNGKDKDNDLIVLNISNNAVVIHTVALLSTSIGSQWFSMNPWIAASFEVFANTSEDRRIDVAIKFFYGFFCLCTENNVIAHERPREALINSAPPS